MHEVPGEPFIEWHAELPSTMKRARELAASGALSGTVVVADYQSAGRGTHGRIWQAPLGTCLMFTIIARPTISFGELETLPLRVSTSIAAFLHEDLGVACQVKPPNDIMVHDRKLCGVLCTSHIVGNRLKWVLCGVGLNTHMTTDQLPLVSATSLVLSGATVPNHRELLASLAPRLTRVLSGNAVG